MLDEEPQLKPLEYALYSLMSEISEYAYCAGWEGGTEYGIWRMIHHGGTWGQIDAADIRQALDAVAAVSEAAGVWIVWGDDVMDGPRAVPLDEWRDRYARADQRR